MFIKKPIRKSEHPLRDSFIHEIEDSFFFDFEVDDFKKAVEKKLNH